jgi:putative ABC transport system ATP-binding protein
MRRGPYQFVSTPPTEVPRIECLALTRRLRSGSADLVVLDRIDLAVPAGQCLAVLGRSGSGKSTLLGLLAGLDRPSGGSVRIDGEALEGLSEDELALLRRRKVGFVFQSFQLLPNLTALENVWMPLELAGARASKERARELLAAVGLGERGHHYPAQLSGGEQQRVALARAFGHRPSILFADEPTGNLDGQTGGRVLELLLEMHDSHGATLVLVTHDPAVAAHADRRVQLVAGRLVRDELVGGNGNAQ